MKIFKKSLGYLMLVAFLVILLTGLVKFPELQRILNFVYLYIPASQLSFMHDWAGIIFLALTTLHILLNFKKLFSLGQESNKAKRVVARAVFIVALVGVNLVGFSLAGFPMDKAPRQLAAVEINRYQGERLGSINDFRENSIKGPQKVDIKTYKLNITGLVDKVHSYTYDQALELPKYRKVVQLDCVEGWSVKLLWEGILVKDLLKSVNIKPSAKTIIFHAADGYTTSFPVEYVLKNNIMLAYKMNNIVLPPERGFPFQLVAEQKWGYKWIKWVVKMELSDKEDYRGFWEKRGYNNDGSLNKSQFE